MTEQEKKKTVNVEDMQAFGKVIHNRGIGSEGTCSTAAGTAAKTVTVGTTFSPVAGATLIVLFQNGISVASPTLAVTYTDGSGTQQTLAAKPIYYRGAALGANMVKEGAKIILRYDGTNFNVVGDLDQSHLSVPLSQKGSAGGVASLDENGMVPSEQLPSYVDDVVELLAITDTAPEHCAKGDLYFNTTTKKVVRSTAIDTWGTGSTTNTDPEKGKIYVNLTNDKSYRWSGSAMIEISSSDVTGIKVGSSGSTISPSQGVITIPAYEEGAQVNPSVMGASGSTHASGLVPDTPTTAGTTKFLREDGTWQTPQDNNTWRPLGTGADDACAGNDSRLSDPRPASDVYTWAKAASKPSYGYSEIGYTVNAVTSAGGTVSLDGTIPLHVVTLTGNVSALTLSANPPAGHSCHVIFTAASEYTVAIVHDATNRVCPEGSDPDPLTIPANGYIEVDFLSAGGKVYVRGI